MKRGSASEYPWSYSSHLHCHSTISPSFIQSTSSRVYRSSASSTYSLILSGVLVGGCCCCCKKRYNFEPRVRNWSIAVFCGSLAYTVLWMIWLLTWIEVYPDVQIVSAVLSYALLLEALVFSALFTWGRGWKK